MPDYLWQFLPVGYAFTIAIETPVLLLLLSKQHRMGRRLLAGIWLTACTYPIVVLVMPLLLSPRWFYLLIAETFAPGAECLLFALAFHAGVKLPRRDRWRDYIAITVANLLSFGLGEALNDWKPAPPANSFAYTRAVDFFAARSTSQPPAIDMSAHFHQPAGA